MSETDPNAAEKAGFTGMGFTGESPAQGDGDYDFSDDPLLSDGPERKKGKGALVLIVVVGLAAGSLFSMHTLTKVTAAGDRNLESERTVDRFLGAKNGTGEEGGLIAGHQAIVEVLTNNYIEHQVELDRNPFSQSGGGSKGERPGAGLYTVQRAFQMLSLKSVMGGSRPLANVNGRIVRVNQVITVALSKIDGDVKFRVIQITRDSIKVEAIGVELAEPFVRVVALKRNR